MPYSTHPGLAPDTQVPEHAGGKENKDQNRPPMIERNLSKYTSPTGSHAELLCRLRYARLNIRPEDKMGGKSNTNDSGYDLYLPSSMTALVASSRSPLIGFHARGSIAAARQLRWGTITEVDGGFAQDAALHIRGHARTAIAVEEAEAIFTGMLVVATFADAGDPSRTHQGLYPRGGKLQQLPDERGVDDESIVTELEPLPAELVETWVWFIQSPLLARPKRYKKYTFNRRVNP